LSHSTRESQFSDLDEELEKLGYGDPQWESMLEERLHELEAARNKRNDIARLVAYNRLHKEKHRQQKLEWYRSRLEGNRHRVGVDTCRTCHKLMRLDDVLGDASIPGKCLSCRKEWRNHVNRK